MIISHKHQFIFVKTYKTAGTSIEVFLSKYCGPLDIITPINPRVEPHVPRNYEGYFNHIASYAIRDKIGADMWNSYFKFCVERNPWEKMLSYYFMKKYYKDPELTLDNFIAGTELPLNYPKYTEPDIPNKIIVDKVLYYENLIDEIGQVLEPFGIPFNGTLGVNAKSGFRTDQRPYQEIYSADQAMRIANLFAQEIQLHGYTYG